MKTYTENVKYFLNDRYKKTNEDGVYIAHQPIYDLRSVCSEQGALFRYIITYQIMKSLSHIRFESIADIGGAEGYKSALIKKLFDVKSISCDLSIEACKLAKNIFGIDGRAVDITDLPFKDDEFDVVICSETLEHIPNIKKATEELIRIAKKAVIITVPYEPQHVIDQNIANSVPHAHIHSLNLNSFDSFVPEDGDIKVKKMRCSLLKPFLILLDGAKRSSISNLPKWVVNIVNLFIPIFHLFFGIRSFIFVIYLDAVLNKFFTLHNSMIFTIVKDPKAYNKTPLKKFRLFDILNFNVPFYYITE